MPDENDPYRVDAVHDPHPMGRLNYEPLPPGVAPGVVLWFRLYSGAVTLSALGVLAMGATFLVLGANGGFEDLSSEESLLAGVFYAGMGAVMAPLGVVGVFLPRRSWAWVYGIVLIALTMFSCCCIPAGVALLIFWIRPQCQHYFQPRPDPVG